MNLYWEDQTMKMFGDVSSFPLKVLHHLGWWYNDPCRCTRCLVYLSDLGFRNQLEAMLFPTTANQNKTSFEFPERQNHVHSCIFNVYQCFTYTATSAFSIVPISRRYFSKKFTKRQYDINKSKTGLQIDDSAQVKGLDLQEALGHLPTAKVSQFLEARRS